MRIVISEDSLGEGRYFSVGKVMPSLYAVGLGVLFIDTNNGIILLLYQSYEGCFR